MIKHALADDAEVLGTLDRTWLVLSLELAAVLAVLLLVVLFLYWRSHRRRLNMARKLMAHADQIADQATETWAMHVSAAIPDVKLDDEHRKAFADRSRELSQKLAEPWLKPSENGLLDALGSIHRIRNEDLHHWVATVRDMAAHKPAPPSAASDDGAAVKQLRKELAAVEGREKTLNSQLQEALQTIAKLVNEYGRDKENQPSATADDILRALTFLAATKAGMADAQAAEQAMAAAPPAQTDDTEQKEQAETDRDELDDIDDLLNDDSEQAAPDDETPADNPADEPANNDEPADADDIDALLEQAQADSGTDNADASPEAADDDIDALIAATQNEEDAGEDADDKADQPSPDRDDNAPGDNPNEDDIDALLEQARDDTTVPPDEEPAQAPATDDSGDEDASEVDIDALLDQAQAEKQTQEADNADTAAEDDDLDIDALIEREATAKTKPDNPDEAESEQADADNSGDGETSDTEAGTESESEDDAEFVNLDEIEIPEPSSRKKPDSADAEIDLDLDDLDALLDAEINKQQEQTKLPDSDEDYDLSKS